MKGKRRRGRQRTSQQHLPRAAQIVGFSEPEEAFFRAGDELSNVEQPPEARRDSWLTRLFARALPA